jgi:pSer/pThr/pTyr-binding forkhead associated (FHA) protein
MARLYLKFEERVIREITLSVGVVTIGRQPDNLLQIDNPAVSGHHAKVYWEGDHYVLEDIESFNGTYVNNRRISKVVLEEGDVALIGKHTIVFRAQGSEKVSAQHKATVDRTVSLQSQLDKARPPQLDPTMMLDTKRAKEMLVQAAAAAAGASGIQKHGVDAKLSATSVEISGRRRIGTLTIVNGKTNRQHYVLSSKLSVIGKSEMATIRLRRWFAPHIAASIQQREDGYFIVGARKNSKVKVNDTEIGAGQKELKTGDVIEVAGIRATFGHEA